MQMKNVLDRLTELAKENPSPDVKQAMENTRRMSVVEGADVVEVHEGVAEGGRKMTGSARDKFISTMAPRMDNDALMQKVGKVVNSPEFNEDTILKIVDAGDAITHPVGRYIQNEFDELQYDLGRQYEDYPERVAEKLLSMLIARTKQGVAEATGDKPFDAMMGKIVKGAGGLKKKSSDDEFEQVYDLVEVSILQDYFHSYLSDDISDALVKLKIKPTDELIQRLDTAFNDRSSAVLKFYDADDMDESQQGMAEGYFSDQNVQQKGKQYAGTKAYHAKKKNEKTATDAKTAFDAKFGGGNPASALKIREQSMTEGVNFAEMHRDKHTTLDEMLNELHDDINTFKQCGQMSEQLRDFMEVHHYGKKQLMDAAYGPVDELADMTKLAGVPGPIGQPDEELAESSGEMINGKEVDMYSLEVGGVDSGESPEFDNAYFEAGSFVDGTPLSDNELEQLTHERGDLVSELASEHMWAAGDDAHDRQRDLDMDMEMELEGVSDGDNGLASAHAQARRISGEHGVGQHVNRDPDSGHHHCSDWYVDGETVGSYNNGRQYDDSGYIEEEEMMPGEESDVAQKAQGIEAVSGKKINQMNPGEIKMAGQKVDAMGVTESKQMVDECGMMGGSMQPNTPANINISASAASGGEVAAMINDLLKLAGRPENADTHMHEPGVVAIDGTMDASGAEELAAMLGGEEEVVDETGDAGGFADATTQPDALVYDQNPVLTQTGVQKHTLGGYHNGDSPLAATTELEESLWRKFQNQ